MKTIRTCALATSTALLSLACMAGTVRASLASSGFSVRGHQILRNGAPFTPYGFTLSTFQDPIETYAGNEYATITAQMRAVKGAWHGNTVRIQVEQDEYLCPAKCNGWTAQVFRDKVSAAITYAESIGLAVVINDQTEPEDDMYSRNEPLPTSATLTFWKDMEQYRNNPDIILDPFNEPRYLTGSVASYWNVWHNGDFAYIGASTLIKDLRSDGFTNQLWMEAPGNFALTELEATYPRYKLADSRGNIVYSYHHTAVDQSGVPSAAEWNLQFGNLITKDSLPVVDGEWTNRSVPYGTEGIVFSPSGDTGQCWGNAPVSVPEYLAYLRSHGIGMTLWTLGSEPTDSHVDYINADGDNATFTTAGSYANWSGCVTPENGTTSGAGQLVMSWFKAGS